MKKITNENYYIVYYWMTGELGLTGITREVYAVLFAFYKNGLAFNGSASYLAKFIGVSKQTIFKSLNSLVEKELILKQSETVNNIKSVTYQINLSPLKKIDGGSQNILSGQSNFLSGGGQNSLPNNTINNTIDNSIYNKSAKRYKSKKEERLKSKPSYNLEEIKLRAMNKTDI